LKDRTTAYPAAEWEHPELSSVVTQFVAYDVLRQVYKSGRRSIVPQEIAERCEDNIRMICSWLGQCAEMEMSLFAEPLKTLR
jgi:hypothetical protein